MRNPLTNFGEVTPAGLSPAQAEQYAKDQAFQLETYDFDIKKDYPYLATSNYDEASVKKFEAAVKADPKKFVIHGIDSLQVTTKKPELKCQAPCYTCLDAKPQWCTSCWGPGPPKDLPNAPINKKIFLM